MADQVNSPKRVIKAGSYAGKGIAVFTSGGDSQGKKKKFFNYFITFLCL